MNVLLLFIIIFAMAFQGVARKQYNIRTVNCGAFIFNAVSCIAAALVFLLTASGGLQFSTDVLPYSAVFALFFGMAVLFSFLAIQEGSLSFTSLVTSYSLIIPTLFGLIAYKERVSACFYIGLALLLVSLVFINNYKDKKGFSLKWIVYVLLAFVGNGFCSAVQTYQQRVFEGEYKSEFMISALLLTAAFFFIISIVKEKQHLKTCVKKGFLLMILFGLAVGIVNFLVMVLSRRMAVSVMFPLISAGGLILTSLISIFVYKEKLTPKQYAGLLLGALAVVLINL